MDTRNPTDVVYFAVLIRRWYFQRSQDDDQIVIFLISNRFEPVVPYGPQYGFVWDHSINKCGLGSNLLKGMNMLGIF